MSKKFWICICLIQMLVIALLLNDRFKPTPIPDNPPPQIPEIVQDEVIRDSIFIVNERIKKEIVYIEKQHDQDSTNIMSADDSVLFSIFSRYIEDYNNK